MACIKCKMGRAAAASAVSNAARGNFRTAGQKAAEAAGHVRSKFSGGRKPQYAGNSRLGRGR